MNLSYLRIMKSLLCFLRISYNYDFLQFLEKSNVDQLHNNWYYRFLSQNVGSCFGNCRQFVVRTQRIGQPLFSTTKLTDVILSTIIITKSRILTLSLMRKHTLTIKLALSWPLTLKKPLILMRIGKRWTTKLRHVSLTDGNKYLHSARKLKTFNDETRVQPALAAAV